MPCRSEPAPGSVMAMAVIGLAGDHPRQPVLLLLLRAVGDEIVGDDVGMQRDAGREPA